MADPITSQAAQHATSPAAQQNSHKPIEIDVHDQSRFEDALNRSADSPLEQADGASNSVRHGQNSEATLGDAILNGLEKMKSTHDARSDRIEQQLISVDGENLSVQDCIKLQFEIMQMSMEQEPTGKIADKTSQGVQTLFKNQ
jgi:hypothetical protein